MAHQSDSLEQRTAEPLILAGVSKIVGVDLAPRSLRLERGARADVDGAAADESVLVEIFAHQGRLKGAQFHKVARDALKLITLGRSRPASKLLIAFGDPNAAACVTVRAGLPRRSPRGGSMCSSSNSMTPSEPACEMRKYAR